MQDVSKRMLWRLPLALMTAGILLAAPVIAAPASNESVKSGQTKKPQSKATAAKSKSTKQGKDKAAKDKPSHPTKTVDRPPARTWFRCRCRRPGPMRAPPRRCPKAARCSLLT